MLLFAKEALLLSKQWCFMLTFFFSTNLNLLFFFSHRKSEFSFFSQIADLTFFLFPKMMMNVSKVVSSFEWVLSSVWSLQCAVSCRGLFHGVGAKNTQRKRFGKETSLNKKQNGVDFSSETFWWYGPELLSIACWQRGESLFTLFQLLRTNLLHANKETS